MIMFAHTNTCTFIFSTETPLNITINIPSVFEGNTYLDNIILYLYINTLNNQGQHHIFVFCSQFYIKLFAMHSIY